MATYHFSMATVGRSDGGSAVGSAAYRQGQRYKDEYTNTWSRDYSKKAAEEVVESGVFFPLGEKPMSINQLWNMAEAAESRKNSTTALSLNMALPHELTREQQVNLVKEFAEEVSTKHKLAGDWSIHHLDTNTHAHLGLTTRRLEGGKLTEKAREFNIANGGRGVVEELRKRWAELINDCYEGLGLFVRVDHRSYERQGIKKAPGRHHGPGSGEHIAKKVAEAQKAAKKAHIHAVQAKRGRGQEPLHKNTNTLAVEKITTKSRGAGPSR